MNTAVDARPLRVGALSAWFHPEDPVVWSGVPAGIIGELKRLGVYAGFRNVTPWPPALSLIYPWMKLTRRTTNWALSPEMRAFTRASNLAQRLKAPSTVDGWVHFVGAYGPAVRAPYVTVFDMSPTQLLAASEWANSLGYPNTSRRRLEWAARRQHHAYQRATACCVPSRWAADSLVRDHGVAANRVHVVGYGNNAPMTPPPARDWSSPRFLFVGRSWDRKNGDAVLRSFTRLHRELPDARLDIVGDHPALDVDGVTGHGLLAVHDPCGRAKLEAMYAAATCFVLPSLWEPFGIVYVEAASAGLPSIGTAVGGTAESVGAGGRVVDPRDDDAIYLAMRELCDPGVAEALGAVALERSQLFTWSKVGQRVLRSLDAKAVPGVELEGFL